MISIGKTLVFSLALGLSACGGGQGEPNTAAGASSGTFNYAPELDKPRRETMKRYEEMSIPGTPVRDAVQWTMDWDVTTTMEANLFKRSLKLVGLKVNTNGVDQLKGDEVKSSGATVEVLTDKDSNVVDVRGADEFSAAIVKLGAPEAQPILQRIFSPANLKALAIVRSQELHQDFVGRPSPVGSQWMVTGGEGGSRQIKVVADAGCAAKRCVHVVRTYEIDREALYQAIASKVADYVKSEGGDPAQVKLVGMDVKLEDSLIIDPATMDFYGARFDESATIRVAGPKGELPVSVKLQRETLVPQ